MDKAKLIEALKKCDKLKMGIWNGIGGFRSMGINSKVNHSEGRVMGIAEAIEIIAEKMGLEWHEIRFK